MCKGGYCRDHGTSHSEWAGIGLVSSAMSGCMGPLVSLVIHMQRRHELGTFHSDIMTPSGWMLLTVRQTVTSPALEGT